MQKNYNTIFVPVDFSEKSMAALETSLIIARKLDLDVTIYHVMRDSGSSFSRMFNEERSRELRKEYEDQLRTKLVHIANDAKRSSGIRVNAVISRGKAYDKILKASHLLESKYIVMGLNAEPFENNQNFIGSVTSRVTRKAKCPVITVNTRESFHTCRSILLPLDLSIETRQKVTDAIEMASVFGSTIKVVSTIFGRSDKEYIARLETQLQFVKNFIEENDIEVTTNLIQKTAEAKTNTSSILKYAKDQGDIDMIMVMSEIDGGIFELFSTPHRRKMIRNDQTRVMSILPKQFGYISMVP